MSLSDDDATGPVRFKVVGVALVNSRYSGALSGFDHPGLNVADGNGQLPGSTSRGPFSPGVSIIPIMLRVCV